MSDVRIINVIQKFTDKQKFQVLFHFCSFFKAQFNTRMVNDRSSLNKILFHRLRNLYKKAERKDKEDTIKAVAALNEDLIPDFHSVSSELNLAKKLGAQVSTFTPLHFSVLSSATIDQLKSLLVKVDDVNVTTRNGMTPLHVALCFNSDPLEIIECLIEHDADLERRMLSFQFTPLLIAVFKNRQDVLELLLENGADVEAAANDEGLTPLLLASALGNKDMVRTLIRHEARIDGHLKSLQLTALHLAAMKVDRQLLNKIIIAESDQDTMIKEMTRSVCIENKGREEILTVLLENGADVHAKDTTGKSALHLAVQHQENDTCVETLLKLGANVNDRDNGARLPLHHAIENRQGRNLEWLLKYDADIYDVDKIDRLALRKTIEGGKKTAILLVFDAHVNGVYESCKISEDRSAIFQDLLEYRILEYLVKLEAAGLHITDRAKNLTDEIGLDRFFIECLHEVDKMKRHRLRNKVTIYDLLHMKPKHRLPHVRKCRLAADLETKFPIYWDVLQATFCTGKKKRKLLVGKKFSWYWITNGEVPDIYVQNAPDRSCRTLSVMSSYWYRGI